MKEAAPAAEEAQEEKKKEGTEEFEDLEIVTTDAIVFNNYSKFHGDNYASSDFTQDQADRWIFKQFVAQLGQTSTSKLIINLRHADF